MIPQISIIQLYLSIRIIADSWNMLDTVMYTKVFIFFFLPFNHALANPIKVFLPVDRASWNETGIRITRRHGRANKRGSTKMALPQGDLQVRGDSVSNVSFFFSIRCQCERRPRRGSLCLSEDSLYTYGRIVLYLARLIIFRFVTFVFVNWRRFVSCYFAVGMRGLRNLCRVEKMRILEYAYVLHVSRTCVYRNWHTR